MSGLLRKLFGGGDDPNRVDRDRHHLHGGPDASRAKAELLRLLRERGTRSAVVAYDGGHDEGGITDMWLSRDPLRAEPRALEGELPNAEHLEVNWDDEGHGGVVEAAFELVTDKWGSFAGEFHVKGRLVVDVDNERVVRIDDEWIDEERDYDEIYGDDDEPKVPPHEREVEEV